MKVISQNPSFFHVGLKVLLKNNQGEYLLLKANSKNPTWHNTWDLPGGRINKDEVGFSFHQIVDREIKEEVGDVTYELRPDPVALAMCSYDGEAERLMILFEGTYQDGLISLCDEHSEYVWKKITPKDLEENFHLVIKQLLQNYFDWNKKL